MCLTHDVLLYFFFLYLPDFNPIKPSFYFLKAWIKYYQDFALTYSEDDYEKKFENFLALVVRK